VDREITVRDVALSESGKLSLYIALLTSYRVRSF
jgi:hypothetical protein|tara:strand:- start:101 stop:202 length:102 start_codon:yes stop_codon:yes gene_type:complete